MSDIILPAPTPERPEILAPAGDAQCFTAALAAGALAIALRGRKKERTEKLPGVN